MVALGASVKLSDSLKSALYTALWTFLGTVALLSVGWLQDIAKWSSTNGHAPLPGLSTVGYALIGGFVSAASGLVAFIVRALQANTAFPGEPPSFPKPSPNSEAISVVDPPLKVAVPPVGAGLTTEDTTTPAAPVGSDALVAELQRRKAALDTAQNDWDNVKAVLGT